MLCLLQATGKLLYAYGRTRNALRARTEPAEVEGERMTKPVRTAAAVLCALRVGFGFRSPHGPLRNEIAGEGPSRGSNAIVLPSITLQQMPGAIVRDAPRKGQPRHEEDTRHLKSVLHHAGMPTLTA